MNRIGQPSPERSFKMNDKFYNLPTEKQQKIINAGFHVFSRNSYKKSPMSEIAAAAGISKALLFHYFRNKQEYYFFLWDTACKFITDALTAAGCYRNQNLFDIIERGMKAKLEIMYAYPDMAAFVLKAYYENDPAVVSGIQEKYQKMLNKNADDTLKHLNPEDFIPGLDLHMMYREIYLVEAGYMWRAVQSGNTDTTQLEKDFNEMISFWKSIFLRKDGQGHGHHQNA